MKTDEALREEIRTALDRRLDNVTERSDSRERLLRRLAGEEKVMKKKVSVAFVLVAAVLLIAAAALAIANYFSVGEYLTNGQAGEELASHIVTLNQDYENDYIKLKVGDAVFDGQSMALAWSLESKQPDKPVYLYPSITAYCGDRQLNVECMEDYAVDDFGYFFPSLVTPENDDPNQAATYTIYEDTADTDVRWHFTMRVLVPNWPVVNCPVEMHGDADDLPVEDYGQLFHDAYANHIIMAEGGTSLAQYGNIICADNPAAQEGDYGDILVAGGALTLADTIECDFTTVLPDVKDYTGASFELADYTAQVEKLRVSFMKVEYTIRQVFPEGASLAKFAEYIAYEVRDETGKPLFQGMTDRQEDGNALVYSGECTVAYEKDDTPIDHLTALTFVPMRWNSEGKTVYDEANAFTVSVDE